MSKHYKEILSDCISECVVARFEGAELINTSSTDEGLYCDFELSRPIKKADFEAIGDEMARFKLDFPYQLSSYSGAYEDGDAGKRVFQRIYAIAFDDQAEYDEYQRFLLEARERDHKVLGARLKLFSSSNDIGGGLMLWHPRGAMLRYLVERFGQDAHIINDYQWVYTPHIGRAKLWETSGHLQFYRDSMYNPIDIDGDEYYLKPMNCPFHIKIYNSELRSYRDLPMRLAEYGSVYRYELSGTLNGLTRVRGFTQDDAHIICAPDEMPGEVTRALKFSLYMLSSFGLNDYRVYIATQPKTKFIGSDEDWSAAIEVLEAALREVGLPYEIDEGGGAFYGPKIDIKLKDALNREWQCSTIQYDFNLPERFDMSYVSPDGQRHTPQMIHRALFGSIERFIALLIEHYQGDFPLWLAPVQFGIVPIGQKHNDYCRDLERAFKRRRLRVEVNYEDINMREKIKRFELDKVPYILVVGDKDIDAGGFSVRSRQRGNMGVMNLDHLSELIMPEIDVGVPRYIWED